MNLKTRNTSAPRAMLRGTLICALSFVALIAAIGTVCYFTKDPTAYSGICALIAFLLSGAISSLVTSRTSGDGGFLISVCSSLMFSFVFLIIGLIACAGKIAGGMLMNLLCYMLISALFAFIGRGRGTKKRFRHKRR